MPLNPLENLHKAALQILQHNNLPPNLTLNEVINLIKEKSLEKKLVNTVISSLLSILSNLYMILFKFILGNGFAYKNKGKLCIRIYEIL